MSLSWVFDRNWFHSEGTLTYMFSTGVDLGKDPHFCPNPFLRPPIDWPLHLQFYHFYQHYDIYPIGICTSTLYHCHSDIAGTSLGLGVFGFPFHLP